ncbi:MAG: MFS transporter [Promethearchaeota archaeon]
MDNIYLIRLKRFIIILVRNRGIIKIIKVVKISNTTNDKKEEHIELREHLETRYKIGYSVINAAHMLLSGIGMGSMDYFYKQIFLMNGVDLRLAGDLIGWAWIIFMVWNAVNDPLFGIIEDRTKSKLGRRIPYLRYGSIAYGILFILIWFPIPSSNPYIIFLNFLLMLAVFDTIYTIIGLITFSMPAEMAISAEQRASLLIYSSVIGIVSQILGFALPMLVLTNENFNLVNVQIVMTITGVISAFILYLGSYHVKEHRYAQEEETLGFIESIKETFKNKPFLIFEVAMFFITMGQTIFTGTGILFLIDYIIQFESMYDYLILIPALAAMIYGFIYFNKKISDWGVKKVYIRGMYIMSAGFFLFLLMGNIKYMIWLPLSLALIGMAVYIITGQNLMADTIDYDEVRTGKRRETSYSGVNALITKPAISIAKKIFYFILGFFVYNTGEFDINGQPVQDYQPIGVLIAFSTIPAICYLIAAIAVHYFPLDGDEWLRQKKKLHEIHIQKEKEYLAKISNIDMDKKYKNNNEFSPKHN